MDSRLHVVTRGSHDPASDFCGGLTAPRLPQLRLPHHILTTGLDDAIPAEALRGTAEGEARALLE